DQVRGFADPVSIQLDDHVTAADPRVGGGAARLDPIDERAFGPREILGLLKLAGDVLNADAEVPPWDLGIIVFVIAVVPVITGFTRRLRRGRGCAVILPVDPNLSVFQ